MITCVLQAAVAAVLTSLAYAKKKRDFFLKIYNPIYAIAMHSDASCEYDDSKAGVRLNNKSEIYFILFDLLHRTFNYWTLIYDAGKESEKSK